MTYNSMTYNVMYTLIVRLFLKVGHLKVFKQLDLEEKVYKIYEGMGWHVIFIVHNI